METNGPASAVDHRRLNRANWDSRVPHHVVGYELHRFDDPDHLSDVVRFDLPRLGGVRGLHGVHLQCHIGTDTVSLGRLGANMSGLDFSAPALEVARRLSTTCGQTIDFHCADVYDATEALGGRRFDFVYTGVGALCWLPDVRRWAAVVAALLRPGGFLFIREGHPMLWSLGEPRPDSLVTVEYPYFETDGTVFTEPYTYVDHVEALASPTTVQFNHGLAEILNAVWDAGLTVTLFEEHRSVPWNALGDAMVEVDGGEYELRHAPERLAATYTLRAELR